jgi:hypothetical protein
MFEGMRAAAAGKSAACSTSINERRNERASLHWEDLMESS